MIYRKLTTDGDYTFGQGQYNFYSDIYAVAQAVKTRLELYKGSFWRDLNEGLPMFQSILGTPAGIQNLDVIDSIIQERIKGTIGVTALVDYTSSYDPSDRSYSFQATVQTEYSTTIITGTL